MKEVLIVYGGAKNRGGTYTYLKNLFFGSRKDKLLNLTLASIGKWPLERDLKKEGFGVWSTSKSIGGFFEGLKKASSYDLLVTMGLVSNFFGRLWAIWHEKPVVTIIHSDWRSDYLNNKIKKILFFVLERTLRFRTTHYICVSEYLKNNLVAEGVNKDKISVIYNGVPEPRIKKSPRGLGKIIKIVSVGRLHPVKNFDNLIRACAALPFKNWTLTIYGGGPERKKLEEIARKLGVAKKISFAGQVKNLEKKLIGGDIYVQPSLSEGFGLAVIEAMLLGLPVLVTPRGALNEIVKDRKTGFVCSSVSDKSIGEKLTEIIKNYNHAQKIAQKGQKEAIKKYNIKNFVRKTSEVFQEVLK